MNRSGSEREFRFLTENASGIRLHLRGRSGVLNSLLRKEVYMDNNNPVVQSVYGTSGINHSSSTAAGSAEASLGYSQPAPQQHNETLGSFQTREAAFNSAKQSSGY